jgi:hypothetical protein
MFSGTTCPQGAQAGIRIYQHRKAHHSAVMQLLITQYYQRLPTCAPQRLVPWRVISYLGLCSLVNMPRQRLQACLGYAWPSVGPVWFPRFRSSPSWKASWRSPNSITYFKVFLHPHQSKLSASAQGYGRCGSAILPVVGGKMPPLSTPSR